MEVAKLVTQPFCRKVSKLCNERAALNPEHTGVKQEKQKITYVALKGSLEDQLFSHWSGPRVDAEGSTSEVERFQVQDGFCPARNLWAALNAPQLKLGLFLCGFEIRAARLYPTLASWTVSRREARLKVGT